MTREGSFIHLSTEDVEKAILNYVAIYHIDLLDVTNIEKKVHSAWPCKVEIIKKEELIPA